MDPLKRISDKAIAIAEEIIKNSNDIDQLLRVFPFKFYFLQYFVAIFA
jgi:hypothetical protein